MQSQSSQCSSALGDSSGHWVGLIFLSLGSVEPILSCESSCSWEIWTSHLRRLLCGLSGFEGDLFSTLWTKGEHVSPVAVGGILCHHILRTALPHLQPLLCPGEAESHPLTVPSPAAVPVLTMMVSSASVLPVCWLIECAVICSCTCMCCACMGVWRTG